MDSIGNNDNTLIISFVIPLAINAIGLLTSSSATAQPRQNKPQTESKTQNPNPPRIEFAAAASKLGVTEQQLMDALGIPAKPPKTEKPAM